MVDKIEGPLGIWPWPIVNAIIVVSSSGDSSNNDFDLREINIERNSQGKIENVEILEGLDNGQ